jgi:GT2 family glycosyltransferase
MTAELSVIIVNWNGGETLRRCVRCLAANPPGVAYEVVAVDNASQDDSLAWLRSDEPCALLGDVPLQLIENAENRGFGAATNQAIAVSRAPLLLLLNPDADVTPGAIDALIATLKSDTSNGACGARLLNSDGTLQHSVWRNPPTPLVNLLTGTGAWRLLPRRARGELLLGLYWAHDRRRRVDMLSGAVILVRREVFEEVGGFDERFHMYCEDNEWCLRVARSRWHLVFEPAAVVVHHGGQSTAQRWNRVEKLRVQLDAEYLYQKLSLSKRHLIANVAASYFAMSFQRACRRLFGHRLEDVEIEAEVYRKQLKRALRS